MAASEWLVDAIDGFSLNFKVPKTWIGLILLPIVSNAAEHATAVTASYKNKIDLAMGVAVGSSIQIAMFVIPLLIVIAWGLGKPLSLLFDRACCKRSTFYGKRLTNGTPLAAHSLCCHSALPGRPHHQLR